MTLGGYIEQLVALMRESEPPAHERLRQVVGSRKACIGLDEQRVEVQFRDETLQVEPSPSGAAGGGEGLTDRETVLDLLDSRLEVCEAIRSGRMEIRGTPEDVDRIFAAIEILIDVAARTPSMLRLSERFRAEFPRRASPTVAARRNWHPFRCTAEEFEMLARLDLLPD